MLPQARALTSRINARSLGCGCGSIFFAIVAALIAFLVQRCLPVEGADRAARSATDGVEAEGSPRLLLGRVWFDKLPNKPRDEAHIWIFFGGGIGVHESGSAYRGSYDWFEFERQGSKLDGKFLHDQKKLSTRFTVGACDDHPPFDLCLTLDDVGGKKVELYGFGSEEEMERAAPGSKAVFAAAKERAAAK
jgi:hypothetical protein